MKKFLKPRTELAVCVYPNIIIPRGCSNASAPLIFFSALSIIPIAKLIVHSTEQLATYTGDAIGGLLNATFGNLPEFNNCN